ncbi:MAG TPA: hypothetical protein PLA30_08430, partial [Smithellaceae bacterium]|nr:hypothetical protein [Smithellaceae bacterium]
VILSLSKDPCRRMTLICLLNAKKGQSGTTPAPSTTLKFPIGFKSRSLPGKSLQKTFPRLSASNLPSALGRRFFFRRTPWRFSYMRSRWKLQQK